MAPDMASGRASAGWLVLPAALGLVAWMPQLPHRVQKADPHRQVPYGGWGHVPTVDLSLVDGSPGERRALAEGFREAFETVGMLRLRQTGLPRAAVEALDSEVQRFFQLPQDRKEAFGYGSEKYQVPLGGSYPKGRRYLVQSSYEDEQQRKHIINEWFIYRSVNPPPEWQNHSSDPYYSGPRGKLFYAKAGKDDYTFPHEVPGLRRVVERYYHEMEVLAAKVMRAFALALNVSEDFFLNMSRRGAEWPVTIAHYPNTSIADVPLGTMRINPHWDRDLFALVVLPPSQEFSEDGAVQVLTDSQGNGVDGRSSDVQWRAVPLQVDEVLVNLGELMARYSNGRFKHVVHQVPNRQQGSRVSFMAYVRPNYDQIVEPILRPNETAQYLSLPVGLVSTYDHPKAVGLYDSCAREKLRLAQGMYSAHGAQGAVRFPSHTKVVQVPGCPESV